MSQTPSLRPKFEVSLTTLIPPDEGLINKKLPKELLLRTFSYLDIVSLCRCAQVCKKWNVLALDGSNWQKVDLFSFQKDIKGTVVENLAKRCGGFLKKLSLRGCESVQDGALKTFSEKCNFIEELNLEKCKRLTDCTLESLGLHCKRLRNLNLEGVALITDKGLKAISDGCSQLTWLNISWCNRVQDFGLQALANRCPKLQSLLCKGCIGITDEGIRHIAQHCQDLRVLNLHSCSHVTDQTAQYLSEGCHRLEYLCLSGCTHITDRALQCLSHGCHFLKDLEVAGCSLLSDSGFNALAKNCHDLERMDLEDCSQLSDQTLSHLSTGCPNIVQLTLSHCELITDEGIRQLSLGLNTHDRLRVLELDNCPLITDESLDSLRQCHALERIELYDCQLVTRSGIRRFKVLQHKGWLRNVDATTRHRRPYSGNESNLVSMNVNYFTADQLTRNCHTRTSGVNVSEYATKDENSSKTKTMPEAVVQRLNGLLNDIQQVMEAEEVEKLNLLTQYSFMEGGKLLRPKIVLLMAGATHAASHSSIDSPFCKCSFKQDILDTQYKIALISEMIHTASLVHDDVIDESDERRGRPTVHRIGGNKLAILVGDYILAKATQLLTSIGNADVIRLLSQVIEDLVKGEFMQLGSRDCEDERFTHYMSKTFKKTASLFAHSCKAVSLLAECPASMNESAFQYGRHLGVAFQLIDDALDFVAQASVLGKPAAADLRLGIATAPVLFAARQHPMLTELVLRRFSRPGDVQLAWELVLNSDGVAQTKKLAETHSQEAIRCVEEFPESEYKRQLIDTAFLQTAREK